MNIRQNKIVPDSGNIVSTSRIGEFQNIFGYCISKKLTDKELYYASISSRQLYQLFSLSLMKRVSRKLVYFIAKNDLHSFKKLISIKSHAVLFENSEYKDPATNEFITNPVRYALRLRHPLFIKAITSIVTRDTVFYPKLCGIMKKVQIDNCYYSVHKKRNELPKLIERWLLDDENVSIESLKNFILNKKDSFDFDIDRYSIDKFFWVIELFIMLENRWINQDPLVTTFKLEDYFFRLLGWAYVFLLPRHMLNVMCSAYSDNWKPNSKYYSRLKNTLYAYHPQKNKNVYILSRNESGYSLECGAVVIRGENAEKPRIYHYDNFHYDPGNRVAVFSEKIRYDMNCFWNLMINNNNVVKGICDYHTKGCLDLPGRGIRLFYPKLAFEDNQKHDQDECASYSPLM